MKKIDVLVTGGAGYIGSHTLVELYNSGYRPIIVDNLSNTSLENIKGAEKIIKNKITFYEFDCTDENQMNELFELENNILAVIHFAAFKAVEESVREPKKYYDNNIGSLEVLLKTMKKNSVNSTDKPNRINSAYQVFLLFRSNNVACGLEIHGDFESPFFRWR